MKNDTQVAANSTLAKLPVRRNLLLYGLGGLGLRLLGNWEVVGQLPDVPKAIIPIAPHTSNWDFIVGLMVKFRLGLQVRFLGKHTLFWFPLKYLMTRLGGIPVQRHSAHGVVGTMCDAFANHQQLILVIAPEGTRKKVSAWKTGFLHIAKQAEVPIIPVALDYARREVVIGDALHITGEIDEELAKVQAFTGQAQGRIAENG